jgi:hypothetical protein
MPFEFIDHRHCEILHRNMALALRVAEELIGAEPKAPRARARSEVRRRRKKGPVKIGLGSESFEKTRTGSCFGLERFGKSVRIHQRLVWRDLKAAGPADNEKPF